MARPKEFDRDGALDKAMHQFWAHGYAATSTDDLLSAMGIGRQSLYDTFGDKQQLYLEALRRYHRENGTSVSRALGEGASPVEAIRAMLLAFAVRGPAEKASGCMGINATTALGTALPDVTDLACHTAEIAEAAFERAVREAQAEGALAPSLDARAAAQFLYVNLQGLTVRAQAGASPEALRNAANFAIDAVISRR